MSMVTVTIRGKEFPLCLTVAALDEINQKCGGLKKMGAFLDGEDGSGNEKYSVMICSTAWMLGLLIREGEENRLITARFDGVKAERRAVPEAGAIEHFLNAKTVLRYRAAVLEAVNESMQQDIEAEYQKNVLNAEQK